MKLVELNKRQYLEMLADGWTSFNPIALAGNIKMLSIFEKNLPIVKNDTEYVCNEKIKFNPEDINIVLKRKGLEIDLGENKVELNDEHKKILNDFETKLKTAIDNKEKTNEN